MSRIALKDERELPSPSRQATAAIVVETPGAGFVDLTAAVGAWIEKQRFNDGVVTVFIQHTSASLTVQENADPDVRADLIDAFDRLAPETAPWRHGSEGPDDMPAHVKTALTDTSLAIPVRQGELMLGTWQSIYLVEHRQRGHQRSVQLHFVGA